MNRELTATSLSQVWPLVSNGLQCEAGDGSPTDTLSPIRCRFVDNNVDPYLWLIKGSQLDIVSVELKNVSNQRVLGSFNFSNIFNDANINILNVSQLMNTLDSSPVNNKYVYTLVVSLSKANGTCIICLVDVRLSIVIKSIDVPFKISSLEVISSYKPDNCDNWPLIAELMHMNGIIAIGTEGGLVFIIDLFLDYETPINEALHPKKLSFIVLNSPHLNLKAKRKTAALHDQVICLPLNSDAQHKSRFVYKTDDGAVLSAFGKSQVYVSALQYIPQTAMLCLGFNFGGFQFYNIKTFRLECSCGLEYDLAPVVRFIFQDPENDPKNHSYIWVIRGQEFEDNTNPQSHQYSSIITNAIMYSISFESKEWIPNYGILYSGFQGCSCRFEYILGPNPHSLDINTPFSSRLIDCYAIPLGNYSSHKTSDDDSVNIDLSLLFISWEALSESSEGTSLTYFAIFDLNQWYRSQMPTDFKTNNDKSFSPYLGVFSLVDVANSLSPDAILSVYLTKESINKFRSQAFHEDLHYYPSSLSFSVTIMTESQICSASFFGLPKRCLSQLNTIGPNILIDPKEYVNTCVMSGLLPCDLLQTTLSTENLREIVLTLALENDCLPFLMQVIKEWSSGQLIHIGCDSKFILEWIWNRVSAIKNEIDSITEPLFNLSGLLLDNFNLSRLYAYESDLKSLSVLLRELRTSGAPTTVQGMQELTLRQDITQMISQYLRILLWFYHCNLLPEYAENEAYGEREVAYPSSQFKQYYANRRQELHQISPNVIGPTDLLLIDGLVESMNPQLSSLWIKGGGDGLYPPPNLHSLIGIFLLDSTSLVQKQALMLYLLLDLSDFLADRQSDIVEKFRHFPPVFGLKPSLTKIIQAFWGLDHKLFDFALRFLLDPVVKPLLFGNKDTEIFVFNDLQQRIVTSFLYQDEVKSALIYSQNCNQFALDTALREKLHLNMLLVNQQISRAFHYQRLYRNESNATDLLMHLFDSCQKMGAIEKVFDLSLDEFEEEVFTKYLLSSDAPNSKQILILYLISNNKIIDAANVLNEYREELSNIEDKTLAEKTNQLFTLIEAYVSALPKSMTRLAQEINAIEERKSKQKPRVTISKSIPIKVTPKPLTLEFVAPSKAIEDIMEQITTIWQKEMDTPAKESPLIKQDRSTRLLYCKDSPFLRTPTADIRSAKKDKSLSKTVYPTPKSLKFNSESTSKHKLKSCAESSVRSKSKKSSNKIDSSQNQLLSLLETPQIKRRTSIQNKVDFDKSSVEKSLHFTPQSILKVKQMIRRSTSPSSLASSPSQTKFKTTDSTPLQHKLRFSVPDNDNSYTLQEEDSIENARLASAKDTIMLKTLKTTTIEPVMEKDETEPIETIDASNLIDFDRTSFYCGGQPMDETNMRSTYVFSPPHTRSSAKKAQKQKEIKAETKTELMVLEGDTTVFQFSELQEKKTPKKDSKTKAKTKTKQKTKSKKNTTFAEEGTSIVQPLRADETLTEETSIRPNETVAMEITLNEPEGKTEYNLRDTSRASTPASNVEDSDSHKSDTSQVSSSKASSRSSRSKTPTKRTPKKVSETPSHSMRLRGSAAKPKKDK